MATRFLLIASLLMTATIVLGGCGAQEGKTVFAASRDTGKDVGTAPETGTYKLYTSLNANPIMTISLNKGDVLGFQKATNGRIEAVYKDKKYDLSPDTLQAYWKLEE